MCTGNHRLVQSGTVWEEKPSGTGKGTCSCRWHGVSCTELCKCVDCRNSITTKELDSDDEESDEDQMLHDTVTVSSLCDTTVFYIDVHERVKHERIYFKEKATIFACTFKIKLHHP